MTEIGNNDLLTILFSLALQIIYIVSIFIMSSFETSVLVLPLLLFIERSGDGDNHCPHSVKPFCYSVIGVVNSIIYIIHETTGAQKCGQSAKGYTASKSLSLSLSLSLFLSLSLSLSLSPLLLIIYTS
jgi:hypothetical protein